MAVSAIPSFEAYESVDVQSNYGTVKYFKWGRAVFVTINVSGFTVTGWQTVATGLPKPVSSVYTNGLNSATTAEVSVNISSATGELKIYGRGNYNSAISSFFYITGD